MTPREEFSLPASSQAAGGPGDLSFEIGALFNSRLQFEEIAARLVRVLAEGLGGDCICLRREHEPSRLRVQAWQGANPERSALLAAALTDESLAGWEGALAVPYVPRLSAPEGRGAREAAAALWERLGAESAISLGLTHGHEVVGALVLVRHDELPPFEAADFERARALAPQAALALASASILAEERWQRQKAELMFQASKAVHMELHFDQAVREIALLLKQAIKAPWVGLLGYAPAEAALSLLGSTAEPAVDLRLGALRLALAEWGEARAVLASEPQARPIPLAPALAAALGSAHEHAWALPLVHKQEPQGLLLLSAPGPGTLFPGEAFEVAVGIAELVALAMSNQHLSEQEAKARIQIIRSQAAAQEREVLLRQIVHDLRNATQAMSLVVEDMEYEMGDQPPLQASLSTLNNQITFISNFLKEKLSWIQQGERFGLDHQTHVGGVFADLEGRYGPAARAKHQRLVVSAPEPVTVPLSAVQLGQIVGNLLDNAIKYTPEHGEVRCWAEASDGWLIIYVADNGPGIPAADQAHVGELGYRGAQAALPEGAPTAQEGSGVGLANVRQLVTRAGGLFGFSSQEGAGTTFHVSLPTTTWGKVIS